MTEDRRTWLRSLHGLRVRATVEGSGAHDALAQLAPVLAMLPEAGDGAHDLSLDLSLGTGAPGTAADATPLFFHGRTRVLLDDGVVLVTDGWSRLVITPDGRSIRGVVDPRSLEDGYSFGHATLFIALTIALRAHGLFHVHAGVVIAPDGRVVIVAGEGSSGKTTTTLAFLAAGWDWLGDDAALATARAGRVELLDVPKVFHVHPRSLEAFPSLAPLLGATFRANNDKRSLDPTRVFPGRARTSAGAPRVMLFPQITKQPTTRLVRLGHADGLGELLRSSALAAIPELPRSAEHLALLARIASSADAVSLELGADALADPTLVPRAVAALEGGS
ncbi:hypothetical protein L6R52_36445 [Myxococcota bacterium]|nr:hypothetical protein [Myxococcota bacterium]